MKILPLALSASLILGALVLPAWAAEPAKAAAKAPEPDTVVLSDTLHYDDVSKTSTFTGNVVLTRGAMTLRADQLVTHEDAQGNQSGTATAGKGGLVNIRQENPEKFETLIGTGNRADYDGKTGDVTLIGQATVTRMICGQAFDNVRGARIVYHQKAGTYEAFGGKDSAAAGGRVRSLAQPQSRIDQAIAKCRAKHK
ncbi:MAG: lipopolysaccharide transport periplasmic protein LptA [Castellaniella sp.]|uniref:lipopolysaccharide transport periplasmic protein LptA n=1 Tax=Castellaniella sp. TaxID=1955812 RepID=UPI001208D503|nr:lipopolysaccharide transport periplasmic protein LptA [Castellaniella sp.]TAN28220.1 MAG: lipopolysaccharide transport periplasmic protein LptA [Castellaniella sp.]